MQEQEKWSTEISPTSSAVRFNIAEIWKYRDLLMLFVRRDIVSVYKQTVLGPLWFVIQPILTSLTFTVVFGQIAGLSTDGKPQILFYLAGNVCWNYFAECLNNTSATFITNGGIFGKVYFPRMISPLSMVISSFVKYLVQLALFLCFYAYFLFFTESALVPNAAILLLPLLIFISAALGLAFGLIISALTTKYRDLRFLVGFGVQLFMYATPIIYPLSSLKGIFHELALYNPMTAVVETFRYGFFGSGELSLSSLIYSLVVSIVLMIVGTVVFNRVEKTFMDTV